MARDLDRLDIDIAALSEVRFAERGSLREDGAGSTLFWAVKNKDERRLSDVGFMIKPSIVRKFASWLFRLYHVPKTPNPGQHVCHFS